MEFTVDTTDLEKATDALLKYRSEIPRALVATANKVARGARTEYVRAGRRIYGIKAGALRKDILIKPANYSDGYYTAWLHAHRRGISLINFQARPAGPQDHGGKPNSERTPRGGASVMVRRDRGFKRIRGAFAVRFASGHMALVRRTGEPRRRSKTSGRRTYPVEVLYGPAARSVLASQDVQAHVKPMIQSRLRDELFRQTNYRLAKRAGLK